MKSEINIVQQGLGWDPIYRPVVCSVSHRRPYKKTQKIQYFNLFFSWLVPNQLKNDTNDTSGAIDIN